MSSFIRRKHLKSRNGCQQCKRRRVKCDEAAEVCGPCRKNRITCSFSRPLPQPTHAPIAATNLIDLELLYNFITCTGKTLSDHVRIQECITTSLIEVGLQHDFLLHAILALSAFHKVHLQQPPTRSSTPDQYVLAAHMHHTSALHIFSQNISRIDSENCHALFGCAFLLFTTSLARPRGDDQTSTASFSEWMNLIRGVPVILYDADKIGWLSAGPLAGLFQLHPEVPELRFDDILKTSALEILDRLSSTIFETSITATYATCRGPLLSLRSSFDNLGRVEGARVALGWVARLSRDYMALLDGASPEALLVLAYYCVLLHTLNHRWWIKGWPRYMLECIRPVLEEKWLVWLDWPTRHICTLEDDVS